MSAWSPTGVGPGSGELLDNFSSAFSYVGLVNAAWSIPESELHAKSRLDRQPRLICKGIIGGVRAGSPERCD
jgi:hypothetical protein